MRKAAPSLAILVLTLALQGCIFFPQGHHTESGATPSQAKPTKTTRAKLIEKAGDPDVRTPDERFFLYQNTGSQENGWCVFSIVTGTPFGCQTYDWDYWARWVLIEFDENGVVKNAIVKDCKEEKGCGCPQTVFLALLKEHYDAALAGEYGQALERADPPYGLHQAVARGNLQQVKKVLEQGADANVKVCDRFPLDMAITQGQRATAELLLKAGAHVNARDAKGRTPLHLAAFKGDTVLVNRLLTAGVDVNARDDPNRTPLHLAALKGRTGVAERLLTAGADVNARDDEGLTPLHLATLKGHTAVAERLLTAGADVNAEDKTYATPLVLVPQGDTRMIKLLRAHGAVEVNAEQRMLRRIAGTWHGKGPRSTGERVSVEYVFKVDGEFVYDWFNWLGVEHLEQFSPSNLHAGRDKLEYKDAKGRLWTVTVDEDEALHVQSKEGNWTLKRGGLWR